MSAPAQAGPSVPKDREDPKERRLSRVLTRVKTAFKKGDAKRPMPGAASAATGVTAPATTGASTGAPTDKPAEAPATKSQAAAPFEEAKKAEVPGYPDAVKVPRSQIFEERAKKISERFGLEIRPSEWYSSDGHALRVEKPIRMRVSRECHKCGHHFGSAKECPGCQHVRCKECQRRPPKRTEAEREESRKKRAALQKERLESPPIIADWDTTQAKKVVLTRPSKTGGPDLVHRKPRQRVRRTCCQCQKMYSGLDKTCHGCEHTRCTDCPRDPAKRDKYPYGYPGDEFGPKSTPHYECHRCAAKFPPNPSEGEACAACEHKRCAECPRLTPRKVEPEPDPKLLRSVHEKMARLTIRNTSAT